MGININVWRSIGASETVINWLTDGIKIDFLKTPEIFKFNNKQFNPKETVFIRSEIQRLLKANYIRTCESSDYISPLSCVPKKTGGYRLIVNLRHLNEHCVKASHKIEDIRTVTKIIKPNDYFTSIDLCDSLYHFKIHEEYQKYLSFWFEGQCYTYCVLPFGFSLSPYFHTKILRPVVAYLRSLGIRLNLYVDDFIIAACLSYITDHTDLVIDTLSDLGLHVNFEKSETRATKIIDYIGYTINNEGEFPVIKVAQARVIRLKKQIRSVLKKDFIPVRILAKTAGLCISTAFAVTPGKLFLRHTYRLIAKRRSWSDSVLISDKCVRELNWWLNSVDSFNYREIRPEVIDHQIEVDASSEGWGAVFGGLEAKGDWNQRISKRSSNYRELLAILMALETFNDHLVDSTVEILSDNSTAGAYVRNKGGPVPDLSQLAMAIWAIAESSQISLVCTHIPGVLNSTADRLSRSPDIHNWMLHPALFCWLDRRFGPFTIDRFASNLNAQLPRFNTRFWEPNSEGINALAQNWGQESNYANPPWALIPRVIQKVISDQAECTLIAPIFPAQPWFQSLQALKVCEPVVLPVHKNTMMFIGPNPEPMKNRAWRLAAWKISGRML